MVKLLARFIQRILKKTNFASCEFEMNVTSALS